MRIDAPLLSSISLPQLSHTSTVLRAMFGPPFSKKNPEANRILSSFACPAYSPRAQQAENGLFFQVQTDFTRADHTQMPRAEIVDRSAVEILLHHGGADVRRPGNRRRISKLLANGSHHRRDLPFGLGLGLGRAALRERDRGQQRPAPRPEILCREFLAHVLADVRVQPPPRQAVHPVLDPAPK